MFTPNLVHADFFGFIVKDLNQQGYGTSSLLKKSHLDKFRLDRPNTFVPVTCMYNLFELVQCQFGIDSFVKVFDESIDLQNTQQYGANFLSSTTLLSAAHYAIKHAHQSYTSEQDGLEIMGPISRFWIRINDPDSPGKDLSAELMLGLMLKHIQMACGKEWQPIEIQFPGKKFLDLSRILPVGYSTRILLNQPILGIKFRTEILSKRISNRNFIEETPTSYSDLHSTRSKIEMLFDSMEPGNIPTIKFVADLFEMHERSIQRQLNAEHISYREILDQWRFSKALDLLSNSRYSILEVSQMLGYQKVQNFHRAFHRWANTSPQKYRDAY